MSTALELLVAEFQIVVWPAITKGIEQGKLHQNSSKFILKDKMTEHLNRNFPSEGLLLEIEHFEGQGDAVAFPIPIWSLDSSGYHVLFVKI